jgi:hypothetical protein
MSRGANIPSGYFCVKANLPARAYIQGYREDDKPSLD